MSFSCIERLEARTLMSASLHGGTLTINGTDGMDFLMAGYGPSGTVDVLMVTETAATTASFPKSAVKKVEIDGGKGDDVIYIDERYGTFLKTSLSGGDGNDVISAGSNDDDVDGGNGDDILMGNGGNDKIAGGAGNDVIYGGDGKAKIDGGKGADSIFGDGGHDKVKHASASEFLDATIQDHVKWIAK